MGVNRVEGKTPAATLRGYSDEKEKRKLYRRARAREAHRNFS